MARLLALCFCLIGIVSPVASKPLLDSAEKTYARECIDYAADDETLVQLCQNALLEGKFGRNQHVKILMALGDAYRWQEQWDDAEQAYRDILEVQPQSTLAQNGLGWLAYDQGDYEKAAAFFETSLDISPTNDGLGGYAGAAFRAGLIDTDQAVDYFDAALTLRQRDRWTLREKGWTLYNSRRYLAALGPFGKAIAINPEDANAHKGMAKALADLERYEEALEHINIAADLRPDNLDILIWRSHISRWNGHNLRALKDAHLVIKLRPDRGDGYVLKARAESGMGFDRLAITTLEDANAKLEANTFVRYWLANLLKENGDFETAFDLIMETVDQDLADEYDYKLYASLAVQLGKLDTARDAIRIGREMAPWLDELAYLEVHVMVLEGDYDRAEAAFDAAIEAGLPHRYSKRLAKAMIKQGEMKRAIAFKAKFTP